MFPPLQACRGRGTHFTIFFKKKDSFFLYMERCEPKKRAFTALRKEGFYFSVPFFT